MWRRLLGQQGLSLELRGRVTKTSGNKGLGYFAVRDISPGQLLLFVPEEDTFTSQQVYQTKDSNPLFGVVQETLEGYSELKEAKPVQYAELELALLLWIERRSEALGVSTKWGPWSGDLPVSAPNTLPFLTPADIDKLAIDKNVKRDVVSFNRMVDVFSNSINEDLISVFEFMKTKPECWSLGNPEKKDWTFSQLFRDELSLVISRAHNFTHLENTELGLESCANKICLLTYIDFFNHSTTPNAQLTLPLTPATDNGKQLLASWPSCIQNSPEDDLLKHGPGSAVFACRKIHADEEVTISYGKQSNTELLTRYGFSVPPNSEKTDSAKLIDLDRILSK